MVGSLGPIWGLGQLHQSSTDFFYPSLGLSSLEKLVWKDFLVPPHHFPILSKRGAQSWGPTPFRFENAWLDRHLFLKNVENWWDSLVVDGWPIFPFMGKLKSLEVLLKSWNKETFGNIFSQKQVLIDKINSLDLLEESSCFNEENAAEREVCRGPLLDLIVKEHKLWIQKSKFQWLREGEENSSFFHIWSRLIKAEVLFLLWLVLMGRLLSQRRRLWKRSSTSFQCYMAQGSPRRLFVTVLIENALAYRILAYLRSPLPKKKLEKLSLRWVVLNPLALMA